MFKRTMVALLASAIVSMPSARPHRKKERSAAARVIMSRSPAFVAVRSWVRLPLVFVAAAGCLTCRDTTVAPPPPPDRVVAIAIVPPTVSVAPGGTQSFSAEKVTAAGDTMPGATVQWSATGGTISPDGVYTAGTDPGTFTVAASSVGVQALPGRAVVSVTRSGVAKVAVHPDAATVPIQGSWLFHATLFDANGDSIPATEITWTSSDQGIATVNALGLVTGVAAGTATITAASFGRSGSALITVVPPGNGPWPNEPAGFTVVSDQPWDVLTAGGWSLQFGVLPLIVPDPTAPLSPPDVLQITYPVGFASGSAPSTVVHALPGTRQLYVGMWWKPSNPWQGNDSNTNKIQYVFTNASGSIVMTMYGPARGPFELRVFPQFSTSSDTWLVPNVNHVPVTLGEWHKIEWLLVYNTTTDPPNGISRWWLDGQLIGDYSNLSFPSEPLTVYKVAPVFGGTGGAKTETDYYWYDHVHLSGR